MNDHPMKYLSDPLFIELQTAISAMQFESPGIPWRYFEWNKLTVLWDRLFKEAADAGWVGFLSDDGDTVRIRHPGTGQSESYKRNRTTTEKDTMAATRFELILRSALEYRKSQLSEVSPVVQSPNSKAGGRPKIQTKTEYLERLPPLEKQIVLAWEKCVSNTSSDEQKRQGWKSQTYRDIGTRFGLQQGDVKSVVDKWRKWLRTWKPEK